jgi:hypothetical protein
VPNPVAAWLSRSRCTCRRSAGDLRMARTRALGSTWREGPMTRNTKRRSLIESLAIFFGAHRGEWIDGRQLLQIAGAYAWRSRVSELRRPPFGLEIENRVRRVKRPDGTTFRTSEYRWPTVRQPMPESGSGARSANTAAPKGQAESAPMDTAWASLPLPPGSAAAAASVARRLAARESGRGRRGAGAR